MAGDVVITGMGIISPIGCGEEAFWDALCQGRSGAGPVHGFDTAKLPRKIACQVRDPVDVGRPMGRASRLAVAASREAMKDAGIAAMALGDARIDVIVGTTMGETEFIEDRIDAPDPEWLSADHLKRIATGRPGCIARNVLADLFTPVDAVEDGDEPGRGASARAPDRSGLHCARGSGESPAFVRAKARGSVVDIYGACAAGNMAISMARRRLLAGQCDVALAGGSDGFSRLAFIGFMRARIMAAEVCRPFDQNRDGLLVGEGAVMFVLEREASAKARGARRRARVLGDAMTSEDYHPTRPHPDGDGLTRSTEEALRDAGLEPTDIDYLCAHGTGTPQNDAIEIKVMEHCFPAGVSLSSIKALTGHTMGAAAATEAACCVLTIERQTLIPTWHLDHVQQPCSLDAIQGAVRPARVRAVLNNSAGFGGYNASVVLGVG